MITAPICEFVRRYRYSGALRMHMPGHKGTALLGPEPLDLTEIEGADVLYHAEGIIRESEANAAAVFGTKKTVYSAEGSSLCIRAMLYLTLLHARANHKKPVIAAGRNAHKVFMRPQRCSTLTFAGSTARKASFPAPSPPHSSKT